MGLLPIIGSVAGGLLQANAAKKAARTQAKAAIQAGDLMDQAAQKASGYQIAGIDQSAAAQTKATNDATQALLSGVDRSLGFQETGLQDATSANLAGSQSVYNALSGGLQGAAGELRNASTSATGHLTDAYGRILDQNDQTLAEQRGLYQPYIDAGGAATGAYAYELGLGERPDGYAGYEATPGFQFALQRANDSIEGSAAARGGLFSGSTLRALSDNTVGMAQQDYGNHLSRLSGLSGQGLQASNALSGDLSGYRSIFGAATEGIGQARAQDATTQGQIGANLATGMGDLQAQLAARDAEIRAGQATTLADLRAGAAGQTADYTAKNALSLGQIDSAAALGRSDSQATAALAGAQARMDAILGAANAKSAGQVATGNALAGIGTNLASLWGHTQGLNSGAAQPAAAGAQSAQSGSIWGSLW